MQRITYTARRSLITGHSAESIYTINLYLRRKDREAEAKRNVSASLLGRTVTTFQSVSVFWFCETRPLTLAEAKQFREFLDSAMDGQYMTFDPENGIGSSSSPSTERAVMLHNGKYREDRLQTGTTQSDHRFQFDFVLREV